MSQDVFIFEVTQKNFSSVVIDNSHKLPVLVEFMGVWSEPCMAVEHILKNLANEFAGQFIFAKVDIDEQPELRKEYKIESVPTVVTIYKGEIVRVDMGQISEDEARAILEDRGVAHESDSLRMQAREKHLAGDTNAAIMLLTQAIQQHPANTRVAMDMVQIFLDVGDVDNASQLFEKLPNQTKESEMGKAIIGQIAFARLAVEKEGVEVLSLKVMESPDDHRARFDLAICLLAKHDYATATDHLLKLVEFSPEFEEGAAREMLVTVIRMLKPADPELAATAQRRLSNLLAK